MTPHQNPFAHLLATAVPASLVTKLAALAIGAKDYDTWSALCAALDAASGTRRSSYQLLYREVRKDYDITFHRLRAYAIEYIEARAKHLT